MKKYLIKMIIHPSLSSLFVLIIDEGETRKHPVFRINVVSKAGSFVFHISLLAYMMYCQRANIVLRIP